jgi:hypothetical protein
VVVFGSEVFLFVDLIVTSDRLFPHLTLSLTRRSALSLNTLTHHSQRCYFLKPTLCKLHRESICLHVLCMILDQWGCFSNCVITISLHNKYCYNVKYVHTTCTCMWTTLVDRKVDFHGGNMNVIRIHKTEVVFVGNVVGNTCLVAASHSSS